MHETALHKTDGLSLKAAHCARQQYIQKM